MNQFQEFMLEKLTPTYDKKEVMNRNDIYKCYNRWFYIDNIIVNGFFEDNIYVPEILKYNKIIGRIEFYKLLIHNYGQAPLIHRKTK